MNRSAPPSRRRLWQRLTISLLALAALAFSALHRRFERAAGGLFREEAPEASPAGTLHPRSSLANTEME